MERLRVYAIIIMVGVLAGLVFLVGGCSGSTDPSGQETAVVVVCRLGDTVQVNMNLEVDMLGSQLSDIIMTTTSYTGLRPGTWRTSTARLSDGKLTWKTHSVVLKRGQIATINAYAD